MKTSLLHSILRLVKKTTITSEGDNSHGHLPIGQSYLNDAPSEKSGAIDKPPCIQVYVIDNPNEDVQPQGHLPIGQLYSHVKQSQESGLIDKPANVQVFVIDNTNEDNNPKGHLPTDNSLLRLPTARSKVVENPDDEVVQQEKQITFESDTGDIQSIPERFEWPEHTLILDIPQSLTLKQKFLRWSTVLPKQECSNLEVNLDFVQAKEIASSRERFFFVKQCCKEIEDITRQSNGAVQISCSAEIPVVWGCMEEQIKID
ncbi:hypothetical protein RF11_07008 [Thelohanellus kitauei]|uniref:Uncharacterized protein n=1 Tax=Thelohanellus kitauei TaxID=669202 RepID=A0A0C2MED2_THEKT|nr:hypothetical protein RF11_07008 [Thelohanellus kitauei]